MLLEPLHYVEVLYTLKNLLHITLAAPTLLILVSSTEMFCGDMLLHHASSIYIYIYTVYRNTALK